MGTALPLWLLPHTADIEPFKGNGAYGPVYDPPVLNEPCLVDDERQMVRDDEGTEVVSGTRIFFRPGAYCPAGSRVTVSGRQMIAITSYNRDGGRLPTPDHVEVVCKWARRSSASTTPRPRSTPAGRGRRRGAAPGGRAHPAGVAPAGADRRGDAGAFGRGHVDRSDLRAAVSYDTEYAVYQHETLGLRHLAGRKATYLEDPARDEAEVVERLIAAGGLPPSPDNAIALAMYGSGTSMDDVVSGDTTIQVQFRMRGGPDPRLVDDLADGVYDQVQGLAEYQLATGVWVLLAQRRIVAPLGRDDSGRWERADSYELKVHRPSSHRDD